MTPDNLSHLWFKVTDLEVACGEGSWVTTTAGDRYLDFSGGIAVTSMIAADRSMQNGVR